MTDDEALAIVKAIADSRPMIRWPEAERWEAVCIVLSKLREEVKVPLGGEGHFEKG